ncbi:MAG: PilT/PilU family type 4a pilus ATPase [Deltaproteobacteria bacterium]|nr:PilT/PilU family type 4a pilus ATPase [Deltaproteobacteria bacterium]
MPKLDELLVKMVKSGASDLHLLAGEPVRMRIDGDLRRVSDKPLESEALTALMRELCRDDQWRRYVRNKDLDFAYGVKGVSRFRCNYLNQLRGPGAVFRVIPEDITPLAKLDMPDAVTGISEFTRGLVLVTGPTGSGKSTTLAALIHAINSSESRHIITVEDPVEFVHKGLKSYIVQREVGVHTKGFSHALRDALLQDPDVVMVGEMRDMETISQAITAAEMGVLVFGTLHTNSASKTIDRIIDTFPLSEKDQIRGLLAGSLRAIIAQQLLRRSDRRGRIVAVELLLGGPGLGNIIRDGNAAKLHSYIESNRGQGMQAMDSSLRSLVKQGVVMPEDAFLKCNDKQRFEKWLEERDQSTT